MTSPPRDDRDAEARFDAVCDDGGLTRRQVLIWAGDRIADGAPVFVEGAVLHLRGPLECDRFVQAFAAVVDEADALTTTVTDVDGWPRRMPVGSQKPVMQFVDLTRHAAPARALGDLARSRTWASASGSLIEAVLVRLGPEHHAGVVVQHQLVSDSWSFHLLVQRMLRHYGSGAGHEAPSPVPQFREYVAYERALRRSPAATAARAYWQRCYGVARAGACERGVSIETTRIERMTLPLGRGRSGALRAGAAKVAAGDFGTFVVLAGAVAACIRRTTGSDDIVLNVPFANRPSERFKQTLGSFMNVCPVRVAVEGGDQVHALRAHLADATWEAARHQGYAARAGTVPQPYDVLVNVHRAAVGADAFGACAMDVEWLTPTHRFGSVAIAVHDFGATGTTTLVVDFNAATFGAAARIEFVSSLVRTLDAQLADPARCVETPATRPRRNGSPSDVPPGTLWGRFVAQARCTPNAVAVRNGAEQITYDALRVQAEHVAACLAAASIERGAIVAVWGDRGGEWIGRMLGVWCRGAVYLPLDSRWPAARVAQVLQHSGARVVLTGTAPPTSLVAGCGSNASWTLLPVAPNAGTARARPASPDADHGAAVAADDLAYVVYTSGSTGTPKGALIEHRGLVNHLDAKIGLLALRADDCVAQSAGAGFDISLWQALAPLLVGGQVEILPDDVVRDPRALHAAVATGDITVLELVPPVLELMLDGDRGEAALGGSEAAFDGGDAAPDGGGAALGRLRWVLTTGEALPPELCRRWLGRHPTIPLVNAYGPTECGDDVAHHVVATPPPRDAVCMPIGTPIPGITLRVLDAELRPVPTGEAGELCVSGVGVGRGYLHDPERTAAVFVRPDPFVGGTDSRLYRTGDRGRRRADGTFEWLGRMDAQLKIRGARVEPAEIEATLSEHPSVRQAAVAVRARGIVGPQVVAYVVLRDEAGGGAGQEADHVREWGRLWDDTYARPPLGGAAASFNTVGWNSRYTRRPIPAEEMREWVETTARRILALRPSRVLEIGCGSGMLLCRVAPSCERYLATDLSAAAVDYVRREHLASGRLSHVSVWQGAAHDLPRLDGMALDLVVLNSVVQYFPSAAYLLEVLRSASQLLGARGTVFVGDVRALHLAGALHASIELARAADHVTVGALRERIARSIDSEEELMLAPGFFHALARSTPVPSAAEIQLKRGRRHNELTRFRYDVVWRIGADAASPTRELAWNAALDVRALQATLAADPGACLAVRGVPNPRLQRERAAVELLAAAPADATVHDVRRALRAASVTAGLDPEDVWEALDGETHDVSLVWAAGAVDRYDVVLRPRVTVDRRGASHGASAPDRDSRSPSEAAPWANDPRRRRTTAARLEALSAFVRDRLPEAMVPSRFVALEALPLTTNGKIDRAALPSVEVPGGCDGAAEPQNAIEVAIAAVWMQMLALDVVGRDDDFFALGGDSLLVYRMLLAVRGALAVEVAAEAFLRDPTVAGLASAIAVSTGDCTDVEFEALVAAVEDLSDEEAAALAADPEDAASAVSEHVDG